MALVMGVPFPAIVDGYCQEEEEMLPAATEGEADGEMAMWFGSVERKWTS